MPKLDNIEFVKKGDVIVGKLVTYDHRYIQDLCGNIWRRFIEIIPEFIWNNFVANSTHINAYNFQKTIEELRQQIKSFSYRDLEQLTDKSAVLTNNTTTISEKINNVLNALNFKNHNDKYEKYIFSKDNGVYGDVGYPLLVASYKGQKILINYPQIVAITYSMLKSILPGRPKERLKRATEILFLALQAQQCPAGKMVVCIEYFLQELSITNDPVLEDVAKYLVEAAIHKYIPINSIHAQEIFNFLKDMSCLFLDIIPLPTEDLAVNYNDAPLALTLFSYKDHSEHLIINHDNLRQQLNNLEQEMFNIMYRAESRRGIHGLERVINREFFRELSVKRETILKLLGYPNGAIKRIRSGTGYDLNPDLGSMKKFMQICWALLEESVNTGQQVGSELEEILTSYEENRHFGNMQDPDFRSAREELQKFRSWCNCVTQDSYIGLRKVEIDLLIKWGAAVTSEPVTLANFDDSCNLVLDSFYNIQSLFKGLIQTLISFSNEYFFYLKKSINQDLSIKEIFEIIIYSFIQTNFLGKNRLIKIFNQLETDIIPKFDELFAKYKSKMVGNEVAPGNLFASLQNLLTEQIYDLINVNNTYIIPLEISGRLELVNQIQKDLIEQEILYAQQYKFFITLMNLAKQNNDIQQVLNFIMQAFSVAQQILYCIEQTHKFIAQQVYYFKKQPDLHEHYKRKMYLAQNRRNLFRLKINQLSEVYRYEYERWIATSRAYLFNQQFQPIQTSYHNYQEAGIYFSYQSSRRIPPVASLSNNHVENNYNRLQLV